MLVLVLASANATAAAAAPAAGAAKLACLCFTSPAAAAAPAAVVVRNKSQKYYSLARSPLRLPGSADILTIQLLGHPMLTHIHINLSGNIYHPKLMKTRNVAVAHF